MRPCRHRRRRRNAGGRRDLFLLHARYHHVLGQRRVGITEGTGEKSFRRAQLLFDRVRLIGQQRGGALLGGLHGFDAPNHIGARGRLLKLQEPRRHRQTQRQRRQHAESNYARPVHPAPGPGAVGCPGAAFLVGILGVDGISCRRFGVNQHGGYLVPGLCAVVVRCGLLRLFPLRGGHGTNSTLATFASSATLCTETLIRQARGFCSGALGIDVFTDTATNTWASLAVADSTPASVTVPTDVDCARLTTSMNGCERLEKSSKKVPVAELRMRSTSASACRQSMVVRLIAP